MKYKEVFYTDKYGYSKYFKCQNDMIQSLFRYDPIAGSGINRHFYNANIYRAPKTANLKRDESSFNRDKRRKKELGLWDRWEDDRTRSNYRNKSWKNSKRKNQYKED